MNEAPAAMTEALRAKARTILVGYDGSDAARRALERAAELAGYGAKVTVVSVARSIYRHPYEQLADTVERERCRDAAAEARELLVSRHVPADTLEPVGDPAETLLDTAERLHADLIVVGRHTAGQLPRLLLGSVSTKVVHRANCDVLVVR